jgi:hypothetical protein
VLFLFNVLYLLVSKIKIRISNISLTGAIFVAFIVGFAYSFGMDIFGLRGWTKIVLLDFQNERLLIYFMAFLLGVLCFRRRVFETRPKGRMVYHVVNSLAWIPVTAYIVFLLYPWFKPGSYIISEIVHRLILWFSFHVSLLCLMYVAIETFRRYLDKRHMITDELIRNSYYVYIIHVVLMGGFALLLLNSGMPSLLKHLSLTVLTFSASNLIIFSCRKYINCRILNVRMAESRIRTITTAALVVTLLTVAGCPKQENPDREERPPHLGLHAATLEGDLDVICRHIGAGSDLNKKDAYGSSPLIVAVTFGKTEVARALIDAGADIRITNNEGSTPLHIAAFLCRTEIVRDLLDKGADRTLRNKAGRTALESVSRPFEEVEGIYNGLGAALAPLGLKLNYERIRRTRPRIAEMLR